MHHDLHLAPHQRSIHLGEARGSSRRTEDGERLRSIFASSLLLVSIRRNISTTGCHYREATSHRDTVFEFACVYWACSSPVKSVELKVENKREKEKEGEERRNRRERVLSDSELSSAHFGDRITDSMASTSRLSSRRSGESVPLTAEIYNNHSFAYIDYTRRSGSPPILRTRPTRTVLASRGRVPGSFPFNVFPYRCN